MKKADVITHFGSLKKAADAIGIWPQSIYQWGDTVPDMIQYKIQYITAGKLKVTNPAKVLK